MTRLTLDDAQRSLTDHVATKGEVIRATYGAKIGLAELQAILADRNITRYPVSLVFDASQLQPGEFACPIPNGEKPEDGFRMCVHPLFASRPAELPLLVLYQLVAVNYGAFASADDAETFGAAAFGITRDAYYQRLCALADLVAAEPDHADTEHTCCGGHGEGSCGCGGEGKGHAHGAGQCGCGGHGHA